MNRRTRKLLCVTFVCVLLICPNMIFGYSASTSEYIEYNEMIDLSGIFMIIEDDELVIEVSGRLNVFERIIAKNEKNNLENHLEKTPSFKEKLVLMLAQSNQPSYINFKTVPMREENGEMKPIRRQNNTINLTASAAETIIGDTVPSANNNFEMATAITITDTYNSAGERAYIAMANAEWEKKALLGSGGLNPAGGNDSFMLSVPNDMIIADYGFGIFYNRKIANDSYEGREGYEYIPVYGGDHFVQYEFLDDPTGLGYMESCHIVAECYAKNISGVRNIHCAYIHTWTTSSLGMSIEIGLDGSIGLSFSIGEPNENPYWPLFGSVSFVA